MIVSNKLCEEEDSRTLCFIHFCYFYFIMACNMLASFCYLLFYQYKPLSCQYGLYLAACKLGCMLFCCQCAICVLADVDNFSQMSVFVYSGICLLSVLLLDVTSVLLIQFGLYLAVDCWLFLCTWRMVSCNCFCLSLGFLILLSINNPILVINE